MEKAKSAAAKQKQLFEHVAGFNADEMQGNLNLGEEHLQSFVGGMFAQLGIETRDKTRNGQVWKIRLPAEVMRAVGTRRGSLAVCFNREIAMGRDDLQMMDTESWLLDYLFRTALAHESQGKTAVTSDIKDGSTFLSSVLRWQDERGRRMRQEFAVVMLNSSGKATINPSDINEWMLGVKSQSVRR